MQKKSSSKEIIQNYRKILGNDAIILAHHYQNDSVTRHADFCGDSLELAKKAATVTAEHIIFCGVHFMAESAATLAKPGQHVYLPEQNANCIMAQMAPANLLDKVMQKLSQNGRRVIPLTYVNSSLAVKSICGKYGGSVCTSSNALKMLEWAFNEGDAVLFVPDKNLARNTAKQLGVNEDSWHILNIQKNAELLSSPLEKELTNNARLLIWPGCCAIHARFNMVQVNRVRAEAPSASIIVHPECNPEVVEASDFAGSTSALINYVENAPAGSSIAIATEINLVNRLQKQFKGEKNIFPLLESACAHMAKTTEAKLAKTMQELVDCKAKEIVVDAAKTIFARAALDKMMKICK